MPVQNAAYFQGPSVLMAAHQDSTDVMKVLMSKGADVNAHHSVSIS